MLANKMATQTQAYKWSTEDMQCEKCTECATTPLFFYSSPPVTGSARRVPQIKPLLVAATSKEISRRAAGLTRE